MILYQKLNTRMSWGYRGKKAWHVGPAHDHYRCLKCYVPDNTNQEVVVDILTFIPKKIPFPTYDINMQLKYAIDKIIYLLSNITPSNYPHSHIIENNVQVAFKNISVLLQTKPILITPPSKMHESPRVNPLRLHNKENVKTLSHQVLLDSNNHPPPRVMDVLKNKPSTLDNRYTPLCRPNTSTPKLPSLPPMPSLSDLMSANHMAINMVSVNQPFSPLFMINNVYDDNGIKQSLDMLLANPKTEPTWAPGVENELG